MLQYSYSSYLSRLCLHDIGILFIEANGSGGQSIRHQIDPQKLNLQSYTITIIDLDTLYKSKLCRYDCHDIGAIGLESIESTKFTSRLNKLTGAKVSGIPSTAATNIHTTSPIFEEIMYLINCLVLLYIALPSATACQEEKMFRSCTNEDTAV